MYTSRSTQYKAMSMDQIQPSEELSAAWGVGTGEPVRKVC